MNSLDLLVIGIVIIFSFKGLFKGAIKESIGLIILFIAFFIAPIFSENTGVFFSKELHLNLSEDSFYFFGYFMIILISIITGSIISFFTNLFIKITGLSILNSILGFFIGSLKAILIITLFLTIGSQMNVSKPFLEKHMKKSHFSDNLLKIGNRLIIDVNNVKKEVIKNKKNIENKSSDITKAILNNKELNNIKKVISDKKNQDLVIKKMKNALDDSVKLIGDSGEKK